MKTAQQHNEDEHDLGRLLFDQANAMNKQFVCGMDAGRLQAESQHKTVLRALARAYEKSLTDEKARIPQDLSVMLYAILMDVRAAAK